ncbi:MULTISPECIES: diguanylate cyclase domain-containing protein [unclassified Janthinobacterium]|uniref:diguanylate cyclase domain-containing protein n=1 Tax=unclassified Janthinobacterium TaxID=2610881 RepID=UPI0016150CC2|nr:MULTISPECIES: diguanylate cyclase [unclassified Janthinobacterium]MBB5368663.1 diguanylate cyclase (GGDEF)-like protein [Janthinobacterium sp. K2C7]MBB5381801.1 diguanylate cyclase (GGDEF)-like protein [Janthinobacterium sp. K2Li3]MBB5387045.1 diguanylate cyclase (GGDEF)-like protein [Janthinobacterium sp. K2E3]
MSWTNLAMNGRILIVDDAMENIQVLHQLLREEHEVLFALSGEKALEIAGKQLPDLILLDAVMPGMDGYAVCKALRESEALQAIPIIFVTALNQPEDETRALEAGAVDFITKPFNAAVVRARVRTQLTIKRQADAMRELSLTDTLTGVANRRSFNDTMESEWRRCARDGVAMAIIMADIDHFKDFNDTYGHQAGDLCLQQVSAAMRRCATRPPDLLARYGGEEFIVLLPQETREGAEVVAQRILEEVRALHIPHARSSVGPHVTVSLGMASILPAEGMDASLLIRAADALLYRAKHSGRDRYCASEVD